MKIIQICQIIFYKNIFSFLYSNEIKRNRDRILEINYFIDNQRQDWADMQMSFAEVPNPEAAALLADDD